MLILLTNDDGIYAPGLAAMERALRSWADVMLIAPQQEQSGVGHSITFLSPLVCKEVYDGDRFRGYSVEGSPADCVKLGVAELCPKRPDLVVSGINGGLNAGINVLYSGTVAAAIEGAFFDITSVAVSLEYDEHAKFDRAAELALAIIRQVMAQKAATQEFVGPRLFNLNIPTVALANPAPALRVVPMGVARYGESFERRVDPRGRNYYWASSDPPPPRSVHETDLTALADGFLTLTPLNFDLTHSARLAEMQGWTFTLK